MGHATSKHKSINPELLKPQGLYSNTKDIDLKRLKRHILDRKIAPCFKGSDFELNQANEECCICMLYYPALNRTKCCCKGLCTECFLQIKNGTGCRTNAPCPFCKEALIVVYKGPRSAEEVLKAKQDEQAVIEAQMRARKSEQQIGEEMARQRATASQRAREQDGTAPARGSFRTSTSAPPNLPIPGSGGGELDRTSSGRHSSSRSSLSLARRQARNLDSKLSQYVPEDILQGFESPGSEHMDLNDLMLMHAVYASLQGAPSGLNERTRSAPQPTPGPEPSALQTSRDSVPRDSASDQTPAESSRDLTQTRPALSGGASGGAPLPLESEAGSSAGSLEEGTSRSSAWSTAGVGNADSFAPSGYAASEGSLRSEPLETPADCLHSAGAASAASLTELSGSEAGFEGLIPALRPALDSDSATAGAGPKVMPETKAGLERFDIACSPSMDRTPLSAKPPLGVGGGGQDALAPLATAATPKPVLANMLARLVGKTAAATSAGPTPSGSGDRDSGNNKNNHNDDNYSGPPAQLGTPAPVNQAFIGMVLAPQAGPWGSAQGLGGRTGSGLLASQSDLAVISHAWDLAGTGHMPGCLKASGLEGAQAASSGHMSEGLEANGLGEAEGAFSRHMSDVAEAGGPGGAQGACTGEEELTSNMAPGNSIPADVAAEARAPQEAISEGVRVDNEEADGSMEASLPQEAISEGGGVNNEEAGHACVGPAGTVDCASGHVLDERGGPVVLQNPDGTEQLVLLTNDALQPAPEPVEEADPSAATYSAPSDAVDAAVVAAIRRGDELLQQVYSSPDPALPSSSSQEQGGQPESDLDASHTSGSARAEDDWLARMRAADEALTRTINSADVAVAAAASR